MPSFHYTALTASGERTSGILAGASEQAVLAELETRALTPVALDERDETAARPLLRRKVASDRRLATAYAQLADLLRAGVPLLRGLRLLGRGTSRGGARLAAVWADVADAVAAGSDLAEAMSAHPEAFGSIHIAMVRAGEKGGFLEQVLDRLGKFLASQADLRSKVIGSLIYPSVLMVVGVVVMAFIFGFIIPMFRQMLDRMPLGTLTKIVLGASAAVRSYGIVMVAVGVVGGVGGWKLMKRRGVREAMARLVTRAPVVGPLTRAMAVARFCRILGTMLANSIPVLAAMQIARDAAGNVLLEKAIDEAIEAVRQGEAMAPPLAAAGGGGLFPDDVIEMIAVGEAANNLDHVLVTIAETIEGRVERMLSAAVKLIEPLMLMVLAAIIAMVAIALILPMARMGQHLGA